MEGAFVVSERMRERQNTRWRDEPSDEKGKETSKARQRIPHTQPPHELTGSELAQHSYDRKHSSHVNNEDAATGGYDEGCARRAGDLRRTRSARASAHAEDSEGAVRTESRKRATILF